MPILDIVSLTFVKALAILLRQPQHTINVSHVPFCAFVWHKRGAQAHFSCAPCSDTDTKHLVIIPCFSVFFRPCSSSLGTPYLFLRLGCCCVHENGSNGQQFGFPLCISIFNSEWLTGQPGQGAPQWSNKSLFTHTSSLSVLSFAIWQHATAGWHCVVTSKLGPKESSVCLSLHTFVFVNQSPGFVSLPFLWSCLSGCFCPGVGDWLNI